MRVSRGCGMSLTHVLVWRELLMAPMIIHIKSMKNTQEKSRRVVDMKFRLRTSRFLCMRTFTCLGKVRSVRKHAPTLDLLSAACAGCGDSVGTICIVDDVSHEQIHALCGLRTQSLSSPALQSTRAVILIAIITGMKTPAGRIQGQLKDRSPDHHRRKPAAPPPVGLWRPLPHPSALPPLSTALAAGAVLGCRSVAWSCRIEFARGTNRCFFLLGA